MFSCAPHISDAPIDNTAAGTEDDLIEAGTCLCIVF